MNHGAFQTYRQIHFSSEDAKIFRYLSARLSVCLSATSCLSFTRSWNVLLSPYLAGKLPLKCVNGEVILRSQYQRPRSLVTTGTKMQKSFWHIFVAVHYTGRRSTMHPGGHTI